MNLRDQILTEHSSHNAKVIADHVLKHPIEFKSLAKYLFSNNKVLAQRSAWSFGLAGEKQPQLLYEWMPEFIKALQNPIHPAVSRNIYRCLQLMDIPEKYSGTVFHLAINDISNPNKPIATRVFAMSTAFHIALRYKELQNELAIVIREHLPNASAGFHSRARKILPKLDASVRYK